MKLKKALGIGLAAAMATVFFVGCTGGSSGGDGGGTATSGTPAPTSTATPAPSSGDTIKLGIIGPVTGANAGFGEGEDWVNDWFLDYVNNEMGGIEVDGEVKQVEYIFYDTQTDSTKATEMTMKAVQEDQVDILMGHHSPETVNAIAAVAERYEVPCVTTDAPLGAWMGGGPYEWSFHSHWDAPDCAAAYLGLWEAVGLGPADDIKLGVCASNDADGEAYYGGFLPHFEEAGYNIVDGGTFPNGTQDFTEYVQKFKSEDIDIMSGLCSNADFGTLWRQCAQMDFRPKMVTFARAFLFHSDAMAVGPELGDGLTAELWWHRSFPFTSSITGESAMDLATRYEEEEGRVFPRPVSAKYYNWEIVIDSLQRAGTTEKTALRDAIAETDLDTVFGHIKYNEDNGCATTVAMGQWFATDDGENLVEEIVDSSVFPDIPTTAEPRLLDE